MSKLPFDHPAACGKINYIKKKKKGCIKKNNNSTENQNALKLEI